MAATMPFSPQEVFCAGTKLRVVDGRTREMVDAVQVLQVYESELGFALRARSLDDDGEVEFVQFGDQWRVVFIGLYDEKCIARSTGAPHYKLVPI